MNEIVMPKLSDTMTEGRLVSWKKRVGETVSRGDVLAEVETDKANMELEAFTSGVLLEVKVQAGEMVQVGTVIAIVGKPEEKEAEAPAAKTGAPPEPESKPQVQPQAQAAPPEAGREGQGGGAPPQPAPPPEGATVAPETGGQSTATAATAATGSEGEKQAPAAPPVGAGEQQPPTQPAQGGAAPAAAAAPAKEEPAWQPGQVAEGGREKAAPVVRRRARELGVDLSQVQGSGPEGRILLQDLEGREAQGKEQAKPSAQPAPAAAQTPEEGTRPLPRLRAAVARIVSQSWESIPHFTVTMDIAMDDAESVRRQLKQGGVAVTVNDLIVKAVAVALPKFPQLNASYADEGMKLHADINVGVAVGVGDGVLIPVLRGCQGLSLQEISQTSHKLAERARSGALSEQEMTGGTFSVSNLGMYGVSHFTAIIYPSQSAVLTVGAVADCAVIREGVPVCAKIMKVTLCADHRLVDGAYAAEFLSELKTILENPVRLLI